MDNNIFIECFEELVDKRIERHKKHMLLDIVALVLFAIMSGAQTFEEIEYFGDIHIAWLKQYLLLPNGIPSHDTIRRVLGLLDSQQLTKGFIKWITSIKGLKIENVVPIDGKTMKGSHKKGKGMKALHVLSAYSCANGISLGQMNVDGKTNEITAIPELLKQLAITGAIVTIDAMGCQKEIAQTIVDQGADYLLAVKDNQKELHEAIQDVFDLAKHKDYSDKIAHSDFEDEIEGSHGKIEQRHTKTIPASAISHLSDIEEWTKLKSIVQVERKSFDKDNNCTIERRHFICSINYEESARIGSASRQHWSVESMHWSLDVTFQEDDCRIRDEVAALNFSWFRKMALSFLKPIAASTKKVRSIRGKMLLNWANPANILPYLENKAGE